MKQLFRKLAHCTDDESQTLRSLRIRVTVLSFMLECAIKYNNETQIIICKTELELLKNSYETCLESIFDRTGTYPGTGKVEVLRSGDIMEYFR
jgi:hypothetical protein